VVQYTDAKVMKLLFWVLASLDAKFLEKDTVSIFRSEERFDVSTVRIMMFFWASAPCRHVSRSQSFGET
jgi:hypothetical protein